MKKIYFLVTVVFLSCNENSQFTTVDTQFKSSKTKFEEAFSYEGNLNLLLPDSLSNLLPGSVYNILESSNEITIIPNAFENTILLFDAEGNFINKIGGTGRGPGEFEIIKQVKLDEQDNLWVYDVSLNRFTVFKSTNYSEVLKTINFKFRINDFIIQDQNTLIVYTPVSEDGYILKLVNLDGDIIKKQFQIDDIPLRTFLGRFQLKGLTEFTEDEEKKFLMIYPKRFEINKFDYELNLYDKLIYQDSEKNEFSPDTPEFPSNLDPYGYNDLHEKWWLSFKHMYNAYVLSEKYIILQLYEQFENRRYDWFLNLYGIDGMLYEEGLSLPVNEVIVGVRNDIIYTSTPETIDNNGKIIPLKILKYKYIEK